MKKYLLFVVGMLLVPNFTASAMRWVWEIEKGLEKARMEQQERLIKKWCRNFIDSLSAHHKKKFLARLKKFWIYDDPARFICVVERDISYVNAEYAQKLGIAGLIYERDPRIKAWFEPRVRVVFTPDAFKELIRLAQET